MTRPSRQARHGRKHVVLGNRLLLFAALLIGVTPLTATAVPIYQSADGPLGDPLGPASAIVQDQSLGVKFHVSKPVVARSIGGYFQPYQTDPFVVPSDILGAVVRLHGPHDFPNSFDLTTPDVLATTEIHVSAVAGDYAGNLFKPLRLTGGWYALVFAATGVRDEDNAVMPRVYTDVGDPLYFNGTTIGLAGDAFEYHDDAVGDLNGARIFLETDPASLLLGPSNPLPTGAASTVPEPSTLVLLASGLAGLAGLAWPRHRRG